VSWRRSAADLDDGGGVGAAFGGIDGVADGATASLLPHVEQNFASGRLDAPQDGHPTGSGMPHSSQNWLLSSMSAAQLGHFMPHLNGHR
jgi:hypothetical protein